MSLKPVKKSDQNKSWMQSRRDRRKMIQPEYHLIVTEGTETEPPYFNAMGIVINNNYPDKIIVFPAKKHLRKKGAFDIMKANKERQVIL